jgi:SAM-dependent methyltransferase
LIGKQQIYWNLEYKHRGKLWRGASKERGLVESAMEKGLTLDNGCGNGKESPRGDGTVGVDFSIFALRSYPNRNKVLANMASLPFRDESFENVLFFHSLDHLVETQREMAIAEGARVLKNGGKMFIKVFSRNDFRSNKGNQIEEGTFLRGNNIITHYFAENEFRDIVGLKVVNFIKINYHINIKNVKKGREEYIIILIKCKSENSQ